MKRPELPVPSAHSQPESKSAEVWSFYHQHCKHTHLPIICANVKAIKKKEKAIPSALNYSP